MEYIVSSVSFGILCIAFLTQFFGQKKKIFFLYSHKKNISIGLLCLGIVFLIGYYFFSVYTQYVAWKTALPPARFLVPPYQSFEYVFSYVFARSLFYYIFPVIVAVFLFSLSCYSNQKCGYRFFEDDEPYSFSLALILLGYSQWHYLWLWYMGGILITALIVSLLNPHIRRGERRLSLYFLWLPLAIIGIIIHEVVINL